MKEIKIITYIKSIRIFLFKIHFLNYWQIEDKK